MAAPLGETLRRAEERLAAVSDSPRLDAEILLAHAAGLNRAGLLARLRDAVDCPGFETLLARRTAHEPVAYILGEKEFFSLPFHVAPPVLIPRPETEHLVETALERVTDAGSNAAPRLLDLCTGSGCVAVTLARQLPGCRMTATDIHPAALALAARNIARHGVAVSLRAGDLFAALPAEAEPFDGIVSNPPYVEEEDWEGLAADIRLHEDREALVSGGDGLDLIRRIISESRGHLRPGGLLALEIGERQYPAVEGLLRDAGYTGIRPTHDLAGIARVVSGRAMLV